MSGAHFCTRPGCRFCTPTRLKERLDCNERARGKLADLIEALEAIEDGVTDNDLLVLDLQSVLATLEGRDR